MRFWTLSSICGWSWIKTRNYSNIISRSSSDDERSKIGYSDYNPHRIKSQGNCVGYTYADANNDTFLELECLRIFPGIEIKCCYYDAQIDTLQALPSSGVRKGNIPTSPMVNTYLRTNDSAVIGNVVWNNFLCVKTLPSVCGQLVDELWASGLQKMLKIVMVAFAVPYSLEVSV